MILATLLLLLLWTSFAQSLEEPYYIVQTTNLTTGEVQFWAAGIEEGKAVQHPCQRAVSSTFSLQCIDSSTGAIIDPDHIDVPFTTTTPATSTTNPVNHTPNTPASPDQEASLWEAEIGTVEENGDKAALPTRHKAHLLVASIVGAICLALILGSMLYANGVLSEQRPRQSSLDENCSDIISDITTAEASSSAAYNRDVPPSESDATDSIDSV